MMVLQILFFDGCATLPDFHHEAASFIYKGEPLKVKDAGGLLPPARVNEIMGRLNKDCRAADLVRRLAFVEHITGVPLTYGNTATLICDGPETFDAMEKAINGARNHINVETFIFRDDEVGRRISELLVRKRREGVVVNLIYDSWGARYTDPGFFVRMREFGINVLELNPVEIPIRRGWDINNRDHRKILVVDGKIAFTGGINFYRGYSGSSISGPSPKDLNVDYFWRDMHVRLEGPAVAEFQKLFISMWETQGDRALPPANYFPALENKGDLLVRVLASSPERPSRDIYAAYIAAVVNARKSIYITNAYFTPDRNFLKAVTDAAERGIDVRIILPGFSDFWLPFYGGRSNYSRLLKSGVRVYEMQGSLLHSKTAVIDGVWSTVGSTNLSLRSFLYDAEVNANIISRDIGKQMERIFFLDMANSREVTLEQWEKRPFLDRLKEAVTLLFRYFL